MSAGKWPGINDGKHVVNRVPSGEVWEHVSVPVTALRVGDRVWEPTERGSGQWFAVNSVRPTRRATAIIVNGYAVYSRCVAVEIVTAQRKRVSAVGSLVNSIHGE